MALGKTNNETVSFVVNATVVALLNATNGLHIYFNGQKPAGSTNFTDPTKGQAFQTLFDHLVQFFGSPGALNCTDKTISAYAGGALDTVHQSLNIDGYATQKFNELLIGVLRAATVTEADLTAIAGLLYSDPIRFAVCKAGDASCTTWCANHTLPGIVNSFSLMTLVVDKVVTAAVTSPLVVFFNGSKPAGSTNFLDAGQAAALTTLKKHLVEFFGLALKCNDGSIGNYTGKSMKDAHMGLGITDADMDAFNNAVVAVLKNLSVSDTDAAFVRSILETTRTDIVQSSTTSTKATTSTTATTSTATTATTTTTTTTTKATTTGSTNATTSTTSSTSSTPSTTDTGTGFGMILVVPFLSLVSMLLF